MHALTTLYHREKFWLFGLLFLLVCALAAQSTNLDIFGRDYDEGVYLAQAHLISEGYELYAEVVTALPPLLPWGIGLLFAGLGAPSIAAARLTILLTGLIGLVALAAIGWQLAPESRKGSAAFFAPYLLLLFPRWLVYGQQVMAEIPALSFSLVAVALALGGWQGKRRWFLLGGVAAGLANGFKFIALYVAPLLALVVLLGYRSTRPFQPRRFLLDGLATLGGFLLPFLLMLPALDLPAAYDAAIRFHLSGKQAWVDPGNALRLMGIFHWEHLGWLLLALAGLFYLLREKQWRPLLLLLGWELIVVMMLSRVAPLWPHLMLPLALPLMPAAAIGIAAGSRALREGRYPLALPALVTILLLALLWPRALEADRRTIVYPRDMALLEQEVVPWLQETVPPGDFILSDLPIIAVRTGRLVPYDMTDTSFTKIAAGYLTTPELIEATERTRPAAILFWSDRFHALPGWHEWVVAHYVPARQPAPGQIIFLRPDLAAALESNVEPGKP